MIRHRRLIEAKSPRVDEGLGRILYLAIIDSTSAVGAVCCQCTYLRNIFGDICWEICVMLALPNNTVTDHAAVTVPYVRMNA